MELGNAILMAEIISSNDSQVDTKHPFVCAESVNRDFKPRSEGSLTGCLACWLRDGEEPFVAWQLTNRDQFHFFFSRFKELSSNSLVLYRRAIITFTITPNIGFTTMSHHSDDQLLQAGSDSFWEPGNYKRTTKRIEDGYRLCTDLQTLIQERAEIEKGYAKNLKAWSKKWGELIEKGPEYGTTEAAWKGILTEADRLSDLHLKVKENLCTDVMHQIKAWQKDNYHKTMMQIKERKEMEDQFKKAQKPWAKHLTKVEKCKADYHAACKTERSAANQERNASSDSSLSNDQLKKMQDRTARTKDEVNKCRERYDQALQEINKYNPVYIEDMTSVFIKCQEMEETRLRFFKNVLFSIHKCLNISEDPSLPQIYKEFHHTVNNADHLKDLKWWSNNHGVNMGMSWPTFVVTYSKSSKMKMNRVGARAARMAALVCIPQTTSKR
ncbi:AAEL001979-PA [Aedes aegypti]|uniref:AAEL001979-PA n=1 Tax=Aedes aegypti TaxID=7159 RepID=Q17JH0_AEDAE|nr:AAEL001979-PA [Aedes aegypti]